MSRSRIIFNFGFQCNMSCSYCYIPFGGREATLEHCLEVVHQISVLRFNVITFGGGDPFRYSFLPQLVRTAADLGLIVHIDTNGILLEHTLGNRDLLNDCVALVGLPLDGPNSQVHSAMRGSGSQHFDQVLQRIDWLNDIDCVTKINTMVGKPNAEFINQMCPMVNRLNIHTWSLYEFWPLSYAKVHETAFALDNGIFEKIVSEVRATEIKSRVEASNRYDRRLSYPFVDHDGGLYVHDPNDFRSYMKAGSIFDSNDVTSALLLCKGERDDASLRYDKANSV